MLGRPGAHGVRFFLHALRRELPGAQGAGAEGEERHPFPMLVRVPGLPEQIEGLAPVAPGQALPGLLQQLSGRNGLRLRPLPFSAPVSAVAPGGHRVLATERGDREERENQAGSSCRTTGVVSTPGFNVIGSRTG